MKKSKTEIEQMVTAFEKNYEGIFSQGPGEDLMKNLFTSLLVKKTEQLFNSQWEDNNIETIRDGYDIWRQRHESNVQPHEVDGFGLVKSKPKKSKQTRKKANRVSSKDNETSRLAKSNNSK